MCNCATEIRQLPGKFTGREVTRLFREAASFMEHAQRLWSADAVSDVNRNVERVIAYPMRPYKRHVLARRRVVDKTGPWEKIPGNEPGQHRMTVTLLPPSGDRFSGFGKYETVRIAVYLDNRNHTCEIVTDPDHASFASFRSGYDRLLQRFLQSLIDLAHREPVVSIHREWPSRDLETVTPRIGEEFTRPKSKNAAYR